ncbi:MAG: GGDEF domain-containing protein [Butyrivibrio sp.]|jgi:diguanylate cyclase (GGDEF)-like protein|nr:GGDEF domain-containing protein [Butyrivibrio sp.]
MKSSGDSGNKYILIYIITLVLMIPILIMAHMAGRNTNADKNPYELQSLDSGWFARDAAGNSGSVTLPLNSPKFYGRTLTLCRKLSAADCQGSRYLMFLAYHSSVVICIDQTPLYTFGTSGSVFSLAPSAYHFFRLDDSYIGKELTITLSSASSKFQGTAEKIYIGDRASELAALIRQNIDAIFSYTLLLAVAIVFLIIWIYMSFSSKKYQNNSLLYLALLSLFMFIGGIIDTKVPQFFFHNIEALCILSYESIIFTEMFVIAYFLCSKNAYIVKMTRKIAFIPVVNFILSNLLFLLRIEDLEDSLLITHISILILAVCEVSFTIKSKLVERSRTGKKGLLHLSPEAVGFLFMALTVCIDIVRYYSGTKGDYAAASRLGIIVFIMLLGIQSLQGHMDILAVELQSQVYKQLALHDSLTNLSNRTAYEKNLNDLNNSSTGHLKAIVAMFDLNDLKKINDEQGHEAGDLYIKNCAYFINGFFRDFSTLFRIGGDEFALICSLDDKKKFYTAYEEMVRRYNEADKSQINFAYGYAEFDPVCDHNLYDTAKRADQVMYICKTRMKKNIIPR